MSNIISQALALQSLPGFGPSAYWNIIEHFASLPRFIDSCLEQPERATQFLTPKASLLWNGYLQSSSSNLLKSRVDREIDLAEQHGISILTPSCEAYPPLLKEIKRAPPVLYVQGNLDLLVLPQIAIVGSRKPTPAGQNIAYKIAADLSNAGLAITSGLALGVDTSAHKGALETQGNTLAVLGSGLLQVYPRRNKPLAQSIVECGGALVSEFPLQAEALAGHFPQRNRIVSGLSCGTLVVEAALKSGSLITARYALQQDREVFAVPGSILSEVSRGCHAMIKSGAKLVESASDIVNELHGALGFYRSQLTEEIDSPSNPALSAAAQSVLDGLGYESISLAQLAGQVDMTVQQLSEVILELELAGQIENTGLGYMRI